MKKNKFLSMVGVIALVTIAAYFVYDIVKLVTEYKKNRNDLNETAKRQIFSKKKRRQLMVEKTLKHNMDLFEKIMLAHGAELMEEFDEENRDKFELRPIYKYNGNFFRIGSLVFDEGEDPYIIVNAIDNEKFARIGIMEEIEAYPYDMPEARIEEVVGEFLEAEL